MNEYLTVNGRTFDKFHVIRPADPIAGFCALITYVLNEVRKSLENNWLPVVNYDNHINSYFYDPSIGDNVWNYYFEPVMGVDYTYVDRLLREGKISQDSIHTYPPKLVLKWHLEDPERLASFWTMEPPKNPAAWMAQKRQLGREYVSKYLKVKPHILAKVDEFSNKYINSQYTIGVHIRGTDFAYAEPTKPETYFHAIHQFVARNNRDDFKLFLATDQKQFVEMFEEEFGERVITYSSTRSSSDVPAFLFQDVSPYKKGEDVLIDILLLSKCNYLFKCAASAGEYALWFNPSLECTDFALSSHWASSDASAYLKLNIGQLSQKQVKLILLYKRAKRVTLDTIMEVGRWVLPVSFRDWLWKNIGRQLYLPTNVTNSSDN